MPEPEEVIIDAAHRTTVAVARLWRRHDGSGNAADPTHLDHHRERLRWLIAAVFGRELPIRIAQPPPRPTALARLFARKPPALWPRHALPATDGTHLFLPARLMPFTGLEAGRGFRALALHQAARAERLMARPLPEGPLNDLCRAAEAAAAERAAVRALPGLADDLACLRAAMLRRRPPLALLTVAERVVEGHYRALLADPAPGSDAPADWARSVAGRADGRYRGLPRDLWWGGDCMPPATGTAGAAPQPETAAPSRTGRMARRPEMRTAEPGEDDAEEGPWMIQTDDPLQHVEDGGGTRRPQDQDEGDADGLADSLSELPRARVVTSSDPAREVLAGDDAPQRRTRAWTGPPGAAPLRYPEWDWCAAAYRHPGAAVHVRPPESGDPRWAQAVMARHRGLLDQVKRRFERLRPRRQTLGRQPDGDEIDVDAYVEALGALRAGGAPEQRLYRSTRPARRELAIALLVDVSGSTDGWVSGNRRIVDVEKEALLVVCQALDALGDPYAIQAFSGQGAEGVCMWPIKGFAERNGPAVQRRIASLGPERYTRAGAALRHAAAQLAARRERHRLLLLLSDGKPNDVDEYEGRYGVEDMHRAVVEATLLGLHCFCLTVDRHAPAYLSHVFGQGRYAVLRDPVQLPTALVELLKQVLRR